MPTITNSKKIRICEFIIKNFPDKPFTYSDIQIDGVGVAAIYSSIKRLHENDNVLFRGGYVMNPRTNRSNSVYQVKDLAALIAYNKACSDEDVTAHGNPRRIRLLKVNAPIAGRQCQKHIARMICADRLSAALRIPFIPVAAL